MDAADPESLFFTCPLVCSKETATALRRKLVALIEEVLAEVKESPSEELACLSIDWFGFSSDHVRPEISLAD